MKFLSKLGQILIQGLSIWTGFSPMFSKQLGEGTVNTISKDLTEIANVVVQIEAMGQALNLKGPDKLKAAVPSITQVILGSAMLANHSIHDEALFRAGCTKIADGMADVLNSLRDKVDTTSMT